MIADEIQALENQVSGRVRALREMFNKGGNSADTTPPERKAAQHMQFNKRVVAQGTVSALTCCDWNGHSNAIECSI